MVSTLRPPQSAPRLADIGVLSSIGIVLVVFGHSHPSTDWSQFGHQVFKATIDVIYTFHMALFFYISGYLIRLGFEKTGVRPSDSISWGMARSHMRGRLAKLIVPYLLISTAVFPIKALLASYSQREIMPSFEGYFVAMLVPWLNPVAYFWFLPTLFLAAGVIVVSLTCVRLDGRGAWVFLALLIVCNAFAPLGSNHSPLNVMGVLSNLVYMWLGVQHRLHRLKVDPWIERVRSTPFVIAFFLLLVWGSFTIHAVRPFHLPVSLLGILLCVLLARTYVARGFSFLDALDGHTYRIYLLSWFPQAFLALALPNWTGINFWVTSVLMFVSGLLVPIAVSIALSRWFPKLAFVIPR